MLRSLPLVAFLVLQACATAPPQVPSASYDAASLGHLHWRAVLVAGDGQITAFDNAVDSMEKLLAAQPGGADVARFSARPEIVARPSVRSATVSLVVNAIANLLPAPGQGCLVFMTSHGGPRVGLALTALGETLSAETVGRALERGCGPAPTVVIASGCFTGNFAQPPMARPNRVVLTAARADRTSFGCAADETYTVFDACLLAALAEHDAWGVVAEHTRGCVRAEEVRRHYGPPSEPQAYVGAEMAAMPVAIPRR